MSEFTSGPWRIGNLASYDGYTGQPFRNVWAGEGEGAHCIARAIEEDERELSNVDANARLIAQAPRMYDLLAEACRALPREDEVLAVEIYETLAAIDGIASDEVKGAK